MYLSSGNGELLLTLLTVRRFVVFQPRVALGRRECRIPGYRLAPDGPWMAQHQWPAASLIAPLEGHQTGPPRASLL